MKQSEEWITGHRYLDISVLDEEDPEMIELPKQEHVVAYEFTAKEPENTKYS